MATSKVYEILQEKILQKLDEGVVPWRKTWAGGQLPRNIITNRPYTGFNIFWLACQDFNSSHWMTMKQCGNLGGKIKEEERKKYTVVVYWNIKKRDVEGEGEEFEKTYAFIRYYKVWNFDQIEGIENKWENEDIGNPENTPIESCEQIIKGFKHMPDIDWGKQPSYSKTLDKLGMPTIDKFESEGEYYSAFFHELGHCTGHFQRLNREGVSYAREELIAELTSCFLCGITGIAPQTIDNSVAYIASWKKRIKEDVKLMITSSSAAQKASDYILNKTKITELKAK